MSGALGTGLREHEIGALDVGDVVSSGSARSGSRTGRAAGSRWTTSPPDVGTILSRSVHGSDADACARPSDHRQQAARRQRQLLLRDVRGVREGVATRLQARTTKVRPRESSRRRVGAPRLHLAEAPARGRRATLRAEQPRDPSRQPPGPTGRFPNRRVQPGLGHRAVGERFERRRTAGGRAGTGAVVEVATAPADRAPRPRP
jgi:hypothetical protein